MTSVEVIGGLLVLFLICAVIDFSRDRSATVAVGSPGPTGGGSIDVTAEAETEVEAQTEATSAPVATAQRAAWLEIADEATTLAGAPATAPAPSFSGPDLHEAALPRLEADGPVLRAAAPLPPAGLRPMPFRDPQAAVASARTRRRVAIGVACVGVAWLILR